MEERTLEKFSVNEIGDDEIVVKQIWKDLILTLDKNKASGDKGIAKDMRNILQARPSWIVAVDEFLGRQGLNRIIADKTKLHTLCEGAEITSVRPLPGNVQKGWLAREFISIITAPGQEEFAAEVRDIIVEGGLEPLLKQVAKAIVLVHPEELGRVHAYYDESGLMTLRPSTEAPRKMLPGTIIHELGHGACCALAGLTKGQSLFDRYATRVLYGTPYESSEYPAAVAKVFGKTRDTYFAESFAEDFRIYVTDPTLLHRDRLLVFSKMFQKIFPTVSIGDLRAKIRSMYGALYGVGVKDIQRPAACDNVNQLAHRYEWYVKEGK